MPFLTTLYLSSNQILTIKNIVLHMSFTQEYNHNKLPVQVNRADIIPDFCMVSDGDGLEVMGLTRWMHTAMHNGIDSESFQTCIDYILDQLVYCHSTLHYPYFKTMGDKRQQHFHKMAHLLKVESDQLSGNAYITNTI